MTGKVLWHVALSLDGFIGAPDNDPSWMAEVKLAPGVFEEAVARSGAILAGRRAFDEGVGQNPEQAAYGGRWEGPIFVLTHHPEDAPPVPGITFLSCDVEEAVRIGRKAAGDKDLEIFGADIARQCVELGLIDEFYIHLVPVLLGGGVRLFDSPGSKPVVWDRVHDGDPAEAVELHYRPKR